MKKSRRTETAHMTARMIALAGSLLLTASCGNYHAASPDTTVPETAAADSSSAVAGKTAATAVTTITAVTESPVPLETAAMTRAVYPIDISIRTDLEDPVLYTVTGRTVTGQTAAWKDVSRETASRYLAAGDTVTVVAIVGDKSRPYALLDTGEYVLLASLEAVPAVTATPTDNPTAAPKPTKAPTKTPAKAPASTAAGTAAPTDPPPATTATPSYYPNADNIRNLIVGSLQAQGRWFPDATAFGDDSANIPVDYFSSDQKYADYYLGGKFKSEYNEGGVTVSVTIDKAPNEWSTNCDYVVISSTKCTMPAP